METQVKKPTYSIENFIGKRFRYKHDDMVIKPMLNGKEPYFIHIDPPSSGCAKVDKVTRAGIHWHGWLLDKKITGFIPFQAIQNGLIEEQIS